MIRECALARRRDALFGALIGLVLLRIVLVSIPFRGRSHVVVELFNHLVRSVETMSYPHWRRPTARGGRPATDRGPPHSRSCIDIRASSIRGSAPQ